MAHLMALYGSVRIPRGPCPLCGETSLVIKGKSACCGAEVEDLPSAYKRMSETSGIRRLPPLRLRRAVIEAQGGRCFYCERHFGSSVVRRGRLILLRLEWDHKVPFSFDGNNSPANFVASCHVCNAIKNDRCFQTIEEARSFLQRWKEDP